MQRLGDSGAPGWAPGPAQRGGDAGVLGRAGSAEAGGPLTSPAPGFGAIAGRLEHAAHGSGTGSVNFGAPRAREGYVPAHGAAGRLYGAEAGARGRAPGLAAGELDDGEYVDELPRWNVPGRMASGHAGRGGGASARGGAADVSLSLADWQHQGGGGGGDYRSRGNYGASAAQHRAQDLAAHSGGAYEDADDDGRDQYLSLSQSPDAGASALNCCFTLALIPCCLRGSWSGSLCAARTGWPAPVTRALCSKAMALWLVAGIYSAWQPVVARKWLP